MKLNKFLALTAVFATLFAGCGNSTGGGGTSNNGSNTTTEEIQTYEEVDITKFVRLKILEGHSYGVNSVSWSPDGKYLASGSSDNTVIIWDAKSGERLKTLKGHTSYVESVSWSPDGRYLASGAEDETVIIWDAKSGEKLKTLEGHSDSVISVSWSPDGKYLACGSGYRLKGLVINCQSLSLFNYLIFPHIFPTTVYLSILETYFSVKLCTFVGK